jgi:hypothetical protein
VLLQHRAREWSALGVDALTHILVTLLPLTIAVLALAPMGTHTAAVHGRSSPIKHLITGFDHASAGRDSPHTNVGNTTHLGNLQ